MWDELVINAAIAALTRSFKNETSKAKYRHYALEIFRAIRNAFPNDEEFK